MCSYIYIYIAKQNTKRPLRPRSHRYYCDRDTTKRLARPLQETLPQLHLHDTRTARRDHPETAKGTTTSRQPGDDQETTKRPPGAAQNFDTHQYLRGKDFGCSCRSRAGHGGAESRVPETRQYLGGRQFRAGPGNLLKPASTGRKHSVRGPADLLGLLVAPRVSWSFLLGWCSISR